VEDSRLTGECNFEEEPPCPPSKYRTATGECNNIRHPRWGNRGAPFLRLLPPSYSDGKCKSVLIIYSRKNYTSIVFVVGAVSP